MRYLQAFVAGGVWVMCSALAGRFALACVRCGEKSDMDEAEVGRSLDVY